jgi:hypothetical protein
MSRFTLGSKEGTRNAAAVQKTIIVVIADSTRNLKGINKRRLRREENGSYRKWGQIIKLVLNGSQGYD